MKTIEEADELIKTFNSLLLIARLEAGAVAESMGPVDPASIVGDVAELYEPVAEEAGLELETSARQGPEPRRQPRARQPGRRQPGRQRHQVFARRQPPALPTAQRGPRSPSPWPASATASRSPSATAAPAWRPQDRERALQRFVRLEKSRSRPGSGLGLSLVAAVARLHGGSIRLEDNAPGLRAVLTLPIRGAAGRRQ